MSRKTLFPSQTDPKLTELIRESIARGPLSNAEIDAQRRSFVRSGTGRDIETDYMKGKADGLAEAKETISALQELCKLYAGELMRLAPNEEAPEHITVALRKVQELAARN